MTDKDGQVLEAQTICSISKPQLLTTSIGGQVSELSERETRIQIARGNYMANIGMRNWQSQPTKNRDRVHHHSSTLLSRPQHVHIDQSEKEWAVYVLSPQDRHEIVIQVWTDNR